MQVKMGLALASTAMALTSAAMADDVRTDVAGRAATASGPKTPAIKTITNFSQALRCMDELFLAFGKTGIVISSAGIPDETGKVKLGTKEMMISAIAKMTMRSNAFEFIDYHSQGDDLSNLFQTIGVASLKKPDYYIRGAITQMDDNAVRNNKGAGISLPFLDLGYSKDESFDLISMDMSVGETATRRILPLTNTSNTMVITKGGKSGEGGGKLGKLGLSFNLDMSRSEGVGATTRALLELGIIETLGKFTQVPYWRCLDVDSTNPLARATALETFESMKDKDIIQFVQRKLGGSMGRYKGPMDGVMSDALKTAIAEYQSAASLIADGKLNFDLYYSLLDDTQNALAALPALPSPVTAPAPLPAPVAAPVAAAPVAPVQSAPFHVTLESDRGTRPAYKVGEVLNLMLSLSGNGTVYCYYEDVGKNTARIFPNQFSGNSNLSAGSTLRLPSGGFKIKFDQPGRERVACIGADREMIVPNAVKGARDLAPLPAKLDDIVTQFRQNNPTAVANVLEITVQK